MALQSPISSNPSVPHSHNHQHRHSGSRISVNKADFTDNQKPPLITTTPATPKATPPIHPPFIPSSLLESISYQVRSPSPTSTTSPIRRFHSQSTPPPLSHSPSSSIPHPPTSPLSSQPALSVASQSPLYTGRQSELARRVIHTEASKVSSPLHTTSNASLSSPPSSPPTESTTMPARTAEVQQALGPLTLTPPAIALPTENPSSHLPSSPSPPPSDDDYARADEAESQQTSPTATDNLQSTASPTNDHLSQPLAPGKLPLPRSSSMTHFPVYDSPYANSYASTAPNSPNLFPARRQNSGTQTPRTRPHATTLSIPGMTRSRISPDGRIAQRDVAAKLVIVMVGLPARGKSYITKKIQRYLSWQQHNCRIFNVGSRRRVAARGHNTGSTTAHVDPNDVAARAASILREQQNDAATSEPPKFDLTDTQIDQSDLDFKVKVEVTAADAKTKEQSAEFFDPNNAEAAAFREQLASDTLDELLDYLLNENGAVGILDATNSTLKRRTSVVEHIRAREPKLGILFIESICHDQDLLEANMRLKLSGPDYKDKDPVKSLEDFRRRVQAYEKAYVPLGEWEEKHDLQYIQMIDVGRKIIQYRLRGFLSGGIASYLTTFNLSPRQIWITRHGQSEDNRLGKLGGDSGLTERGQAFGRALYNFTTQKRREWLVEQMTKIAQSSFPPQPGDHTPPYPEPDSDLGQKNFCVWTSMLRRSIETAAWFEADDDYDVKNWEMLNELNAGLFEGLTYGDVAAKYPEEFEKRSRDKLNYIYPGVGGEGYLQVISRLRDMVREIERITDHVLIVAHRSICRVLMAYFMDLTREDIAEVDVPLGMLYAIEPKPYGIEFHAYRYNEAQGWFDEIADYKPRRIHR